jgi:DNA polymerase-4
MPLRMLFVDMNAYFASVEQQERPELRGRPVGVVAVMTDSTCCIAVSYEAKRMGVKGGMGVGEARRLCPDIRIVEARPKLYVEYHHRIRNAIETCLPIGGKESVDEFWCPLSDREREPAPAVALANQVKRAIREKVGPYVKCSIGLAPNKFLAKVASDMQKPDGLTVLTADDLPHKLYSLQLEDFAGIASRMHARLRRHGIFTAQQLCAAPKPLLVKVWGGVVGQYWWHWLRGEETHHPPTRKQMIGHSHVLSPERRTDDGAKAVLSKLIHRAALRLRKEQYWARWMEIYISYTYREEGWRAVVPLGLCQDTLTMIQSLEALWPHHPPLKRPTQVGVALLGLVPDAYAPLPLFPEERRRIQLARVMDAVNDHLGHNKVYVCGMESARLDAPTRIAFNRMPDEDDPDYEQFAFS